MIFAVKTKNSGYPLMDQYIDMTNAHLIQHVVETAPERTTLELQLIERLQFACDELDRMTAAQRVLAAGQGPAHANA